MKFNFDRKRILNIFGILILCGASFGAGFLVNDKTKNPNQALIDAAFRSISNDSLFNQQTDRELSYIAIRGMIDTIHDPYVELIEPEAAQNFNNTFSGQTGVVGLYAESKSDQVVISIVFPNSPAEKAGIHVGDIILAIDNETLDKDTDSSETGLMIRGVPGSTVNLKILRENQTLEFALVRQVREYVNFKMLPNGIGYVALNAFNKTAADQMKKALESLMADKPIGLIWDLRNNEGGDMQAAQNILSYFIKDGLLFTAQLTHDRSVKFMANGKTITSDIPLVVLMDKTTYSAAETSAAAIEETGRGRTIGSKSFGKGVIQATIPLVNGAMLQMTIAKWLSPNGEWYQERGVPPQIEIIDDPSTETDELMETAKDLLLKK